MNQSLKTVSSHGIAPGLILTALLILPAIAGAAESDPQPDPLIQPDVWQADAWQAGRQSGLRTQMGRQTMRSRMLENRQQGIENWYAMTSDPVKAALVQMQAIERIYRQRKDATGLIAFYQNVLAGTEVPALRNTAYLRLSQLSARTDDPESALEMLESALQENLQRMN